MSTDVWKKGNETMKSREEKVSDIKAIIFIIALFGIIFLIGYFGNKTRYRTTTGTYNNGTITTKDGNVWKVSNYNGISTNKSVKVSVKFDTKGTDSVLDDEIVEIKEK